MAIGTGAALLGSALIGGASSIFGARSANRAAENNARAAAANVGAANQALYDAQPIAIDNYGHARDAMVGGLKQGQDAWWDRMGYTAGMANRGINELWAMNPNYGGNTQFSQKTASGINPNYMGYTGFNRPTDFGRNTDFTRNTEIGGQWDNLKSQNFLQSPDYQFRKQEALDAVQGSAAGQGGLYSGQTLKDITDRASNLAAGEYGNWFNRQAGLADRDYGADVANYDRAANQFASNYGRAQDQFGQNYGRANQQFADNFARQYGVFSDNFNRGEQQFGNEYQRNADQFANNFARDYGVFSDNYGRDQDRWRYLTNQGINALTSGASLDQATAAGIGQANADMYGQIGQNAMNVAQGYSNNFMGNAGIQANTPYVSPWGGINQAVQGGLQNYLWAQNAGLWPTQTATKPGAGAPGNYMYGMA